MPTTHPLSCQRGRATQNRETSGLLAALHPGYVAAGSYRLRTEFEAGVGAAAHLVRAGAAQAERGRARVADVVLGEVRPAQHPEPRRLRGAVDRTLTGGVAELVARRDLRGLLLVPGACRRGEGQAAGGDVAADTVVARAGAAQHRALADEVRLYPRATNAGR